MTYHEHHHNSKGKGLFGAVMLILFGFLLLLNNFDYIDFGDFMRRYWPLFLIFWGVYLILKRDSSPLADIKFGDQMKECTSETANYSNNFGDVQVSIISKNFQSGRISNSFGDIKVNLQNMDIESGEKTLHISGVFGSISIMAPKNIEFITKCNIGIGDIKLFGNKVDGFSKQSEYKSAGYDTADKKLNLVVSHVIGDIKIW